MQILSIFKMVKGSCEFSKFTWAFLLLFSGLSQLQDMELQVFHAGTALKDGCVVSSGGRVLTVTAVRPALETALQAANQGVTAIGFPGAVYRRDIGHRAITHLKQRRCVWC